MRKPFIAGNWKMHKTLSEARELVRALRAGLADRPAVDVAICPPYTLLSAVAQEIAGSPIKLGAQNVYCEPKGAFTGEIAPGMLKDVGCEYVIIGHSERRQHFGETGDLLHRKVRAALEANLAVIYCVGETLDEREAGRTEAVVERHLGEVISEDIPVERLTIAYEPVWAIGTGRTATPDQAQAVHAFIRPKLAEILSPAAADTIRIQYGGSVKPDNAADLIACPDVDGALVGGACLVADDFLAIISAAARVAGRG
jgi:triosephosphate isomerase